MVRRIAGFVAGLFVLVVCVQLAEIGVHAMHPFPPGVDRNNFEEIKKFVASLPLKALLLVLAGHLAGILTGCFTAAKIAGTRIPAYILGAIAICLGIVNAVIIPQPIWFSVVALAIYAGSMIIGARLGAPRPALQPAVPQA